MLQLYFMTLSFLLLILKEFLVSAFLLPLSFLERQNINHQRHQQRLLWNSRTTTTTTTTELSLPSFVNSNSNINNNNNNNNNNEVPIIETKSKSKKLDSIDIENGPFIDPTTTSQLVSHWGRKPLLIRKAFDPSSLEISKAWPTWDDICNWASYDDDGDELVVGDYYYEHDTIIDNDKYEDENDYDNEELFYHDGGDISVMSRLVRKENDNLDSFTLEIGPFSKSFLQDLMNSNDSNSNSFSKKNDDESVSSSSSSSWTLLLNDVDRIYPPLNDWIESTFSHDFLPRWRRDDGMISIAKKGGGIGPHVDNYDVFLIQTSGQRKWLLGDYMSTQEEMDALIDGLDVRVLDIQQKKNNNDDYNDSDNVNDEQHNNPSNIVVEMNPGDMLYLPPRLIHWGTALSDDCMTLSVGCRAPSAAELVSRVAEYLSYSTSEKACQRYTDINLLSSSLRRIKETNNEAKTQNDDKKRLMESATSITLQNKNDMKQMVMEAVQEVLEDSVLWDEMVGIIVTEPKRPTEMTSIYHDNVNDNETDDNGTDISPMAHVRAAFVDGVGALYPTAGVSFATSQCYNETYVFNRIFADGCMFEWKISRKSDDGDYDNRTNANTVLSSQAVLSSFQKLQPLQMKMLELPLEGSSLPSEALSVLKDLLQQGFLYYDVDENDSEE